jgi:hypothetical protein
MGLFSSWFGPSWSERVAVFMQERRLPVEERVRLCVKNLVPNASPVELAQSHPLAEIKAALAVHDNHEELTHLAVAMSTRLTMRCPVVLLKKASEKNWHLSVITDRRLASGDELRYRRITKGEFILWCPVGADGQDLAPIPG